jgi:quinolinate synthase
MSETIDRVINLELPEFTVPGHRLKPRSEADDASLKEQIKVLLEKHNAVLVAHYYTDAAIQALADESGSWAKRRKS